MRIKQKPEDFIVKEITNVKPVDKGEYTYFLLKKRKYNTIDAIETIAKALNIGFVRFGFAGNKDRNAITEQLVSAKDVKKEDLERLKLKDLEIKVLGYGDNYIYLGNLEGNEFIITVKDLSEKELDNFNGKINKKILMPNYFGEQRFSSQNIDVGKAIIKRDFKEVSRLLRLDIIDNDYIGAIRKVNKKILRIYVHAYQSYIFNETVKEYLKYVKENEKMPVVGFGTELDKYNGKIKRIINEILGKEEISLRDFITLKMPELSEEGSERNLFVKTENLEILEKSEDLLKIKFFLKKGSYATEAINYLLESS